LHRTAVTHAIYVFGFADFGDAEWHECRPGDGYGHDYGGAALCRKWAHPDGWRFAVGPAGTGTPGGDGRARTCSLTTAERVGTSGSDDARGPFLGGMWQQPTSMQSRSGNALKRQFGIEGANMNWEAISNMIFAGSVLLLSILMQYFFVMFGQGKLEGVEAAQEAGGTTGAADTGSPADQRATEEAGRKGLSPKHRRAALPPLRGVRRGGPWALAC